MNSVQSQKRRDAKRRGAKGKGAMKVETSTMALRATSVAFVVVIAYYLGDYSLFSWHPVCMSVGYMALMTEAVRTAVAFRTTTGEERVRQITKHMVLNLCALALIVVGFSAIYKNKIRLGKSHFMSWHGKLGLTVFISSILVVLGGLLSFKKVGLIHMFPEKKHATIKRIHRIGGVFTYFLSIFVIELGLMSVFASKVIQVLMQTGVGAVALLILVISLKGEGNASKGGAKEEDALLISTQR